MKVTPETFLKDVSGHVMAVKLDEGLHRHIIFRQPKNSNQWYEILTWPGCLTIHGDMGTWRMCTCARWPGSSTGSLMRRRKHERV